MSAEPHEIVGRDDSLARQLRALAHQLDSSSSRPNGPAIRAVSNAAMPTTSAPAGLSSHPPGRRVALAVVAGVAVILGGLGLLRAMQNNEPVQTVSALDLEPDSTSLSEGEMAAPSPTTNEPDGIPSVVDAMPRPASAAEVGPNEARLLPPADAGYQLLEAAQLLHSEADLRPLPPSPNLPVLSAFYTDNEGSASLRLHLATYGAESDADFAMEFAQSHAYLQTDVIDEDGLSGIWIGDERAFAPYVGSPDDQSIIGTAEIRIDEARVLTVVGIDLSRELAVSLALQMRAADDDEVFPPAPEGYTAPMIMAGPAVSTFRTDIDQLALTLSDRATGELVDIMIQPADPDAWARETGETASVVGTTGLGWYGHGLWGAAHLTWIRPDVVVLLTSPTGNLSFEQLVAFAESLEWLDETQWVERTVGATLVRTPVHP